jgi:hypothetical protein
VLQVPASAHFLYREDWPVFVAKNGRVRLQPVQIGHRSGLAAEIVSPLKEGDLVVLHPNDPLADGARISLRRTLAHPERCKRAEDTTPFGSTANRNSQGTTTEMLMNLYGKLGRKSRLPNSQFRQQID